MLTGGQDENTDQMIARILQYLEPARQAAEASNARDEALASARKQLEISLLDAQGKAEEVLAERRKLELASMDESLRPLAQQIYAAQDLATAADKAAKAQADATRAQEDASRAAADHAANLERLRSEHDSSNATLVGMVKGLNDDLGINNIKSALDALSVSQVNLPQDRLAAAQGIFNRTLSAARGGDLGAVNDFPGVVQQLIGIGRDTFASGPEFQRIFVEANRALSEVLDRQQGIANEILASVPDTIRETSADQIGVLKAGFAQVTARLEALAQEIRAAA